MLTEKLNWKRIRHAFSWRARHYSEKLMSCLVLLLTRLRWALPGKKAAAHDLPHPLLVSLTSYRPRFATLLPTLQCLLLQDMKPDMIILWIDERDKGFLPADICALERQGLTIIATPENIGPYKKIIPALERYPDSFIATADDDVYYRPGWLRELVEAWDGKNKTITCHRAHQILFDALGQPKPYAEWKHEAGRNVASDLLFPTGVGGILYPPHCLRPDVTDSAQFTRISPKADDIWLFWKARQEGCRYIKTAYKGYTLTWPGSQQVSLVSQNIHQGHNDGYIEAMIKAFGWPAEKPT